jgi:hypothetical protein
MEYGCVARCMHLRSFSTDADKRDAAEINAPFLLNGKGWNPMCDAIHIDDLFGG